MRGGEAWYVDLQRKPFLHDLQCVHVCRDSARLTSMEIRRWTLFLRQTPVGDWTSSEDVPDAWSLSPSDPIFRFSWTISEKKSRIGHKRALDKNHTGTARLRRFRSDPDRLMINAVCRTDLNLLESITFIICLSVALKKKGKNKEENTQS